MVYFQVARKLAMVEADLERAEERAESGESYVFRVILCVCVCCMFFSQIVLMNTFDLQFLG
jgi:hypothetical protein